MLTKQLMNWYVKVSVITSSYLCAYRTIWGLAIVPFVAVSCVRIIVLLPAWQRRYFCVWSVSATSVPAWKDRPAYPRRASCKFSRDPWARGRRCKTKGLLGRVRCDRNCWKWRGWEGARSTSWALKGSRSQRGRSPVIRLPFVPRGTARVAVANWAVGPSALRFFGWLRWGIERGSRGPRLQLHRRRRWRTWVRRGFPCFCPRGSLCPLSRASSPTTRHRGCRTPRWRRSSAAPPRCCRTPASRRPPGCSRTAALVLPAAVPPIWTRRCRAGTVLSHLPSFAVRGRESPRCACRCGWGLKNRCGPRWFLPLVVPWGPALPFCSGFGAAIWCFSRLPRRCSCVVLRWEFKCSLP